jgi:chromosomal replication initiation ATPase DnaA
MIAPNIFQPRNNWNISVFRCKKTDNSLQERIFKIIKEETGMDVKVNTSYRGGRENQARQLFMAMMVRHTKGTQSNIGKIIGKDHSTVVHAIKTVNNLCDTDKDYRLMYKRIDDKIKNYGNDLLPS